MSRPLWKSRPKWLLFRSMDLWRWWRLRSNKWRKSVNHHFFDWNETFSCKIFQSSYIITDRDISNLGNLIESAWGWKSRRGIGLGLLVILWKHKTVATLGANQRCPSFLRNINEGGTTLRRPLEEVAFWFLHEDIKGWWFNVQDTFHPFGY